MLGWLWRMIVGRFGFCKHKWKIIKASECGCPGGGIWTRHYSQCELCGTIKCFDV